MLFHGLMVHSSMLLSSIQVQMNHNLIIHLSVGGPLAYFHILKFMCKFLWEHMFSVVTGMYLWVELLYHMVNGNPLQYSCLENPMDKRSLVGYSPWSHKESDTTGRLTDTSNNFSWLFRHSSSSSLISFSICLPLEFSVSGVINWLTNRGVRSYVSPSAQWRIHTLSPNMVFNCHLLWINTKYVQYYYYVKVNHNLAIWYNVIGFHSLYKVCFFC